MKDINLYIIEKFKITKKTTVSNHSLKEGEKLIKITVRIPKGKNYIQLDISLPAKFVRIKNDILVVYYNNFEKGQDVAGSFKNDNGYLQYNFNSQEEVINIFLNESDAIDYLTKCRDNIDSIDRTFIESIVTIKDPQKLLGRKIACLQSKEVLNKYLKELAF